MPSWPSSATRSRTGAVRGFRQEGRSIAAKETVRINDRIRAREIRLIGAEGEQLGVMTPDEARSKADEEGLDLVEVAPNSSPPVCRIMDYGKYKYEEKKKRAAGKVKAHAATLKEVKLRPGTDQHDLEFKLKNARRFLVEGDKVKVTVMFRGREMVHRKLGYRQLERVREMLGEIATKESDPRMEGRFLSMILVPNKDAIAREQQAEAKLKKLHEGGEDKLAAETGSKPPEPPQVEKTESGAGEVDA
jgi:translation initiation factor IF-3